MVDFKVCLDVVGRDADGNVTGTWHNSEDLITAQWAEFAALNILFPGSTGGTINVTDTAGTVNSCVGPQAFKANSLYIVAGIGATAATVADTVIGTITSGSSGSILAVLGTFTESGSSGSFTITGTITNSSGSTIQYTELALYQSGTVGAALRTWMLTHDVFTAVPVSTTGTLAITYTITNS